MSCEVKLCEMSGVRSTEEATEEEDEEEEEEPGVSEQKQKPHTKMWGKISFMAIWMHMNTLSMYVCVCTLPFSIVIDLDKIYVYIHHLCLKDILRRLHVST